MSQKPVLFPGAALSRNSIMRNSAVQASAYVAMDASSARLPVTCDEALVTDGANPLTANRARFARLKLRDPASQVAASITSFHGAHAGADTVVGAALYEYRPQQYGFSLALIQGGFKTIKGVTASETDILIQPVVSLNRTKTYVIGVVNASPASFASDCKYHSLPPTMTLTAVTYLESAQDITIATGWPKQLECRAMYNMATSGDLLFGFASNLWSVVLNVTSDNNPLFGLMY